MKIHIKLIFYARALSFAALLGVGIASTATAAIVADDWYANYSADRGLEIENGASGSPTYRYNTGASSKPRAISAIWSYFDPVTLNDGMSMTLNTQVTVDFLSSAVTGGTFSVLRFGFFDSRSTTRATVESFGPDRYIATLPGPADQTTGWSGFMMGVNEPNLNRMVPGAGLYYSTVSAGVSRQALTTTLPPAVFADNVALDLTLTFLRSGNDLIVSGALGGDTFNGTYTGAFEDGYSDFFDAFGFYSGDNAASSTLNSVTFSNTSITVIPEPNTLGLLLFGCLGLGMARGWLVCRRRS